MGISITGLVSGLDTAQIVSDMMDVERIPYKSLETKKTNLQSEQTIFRNINTAFRSLETALNNLKLGPDWEKIAGKSSNTGTLGISISNPEGVGKYQVNVVQLAQKNVVQLDGGFILDKIKDGEIKIGSSGVKIDYVPPGPDEEISVEQQLNNLAKSINDKSKEAGVSASVVRTSAAGDEYKLVLSSLNTGNETEDGETNLVNFNVGGKDLANDIDAIKNKQVLNNAIDGLDSSGNIIKKTLNAIVQIDGVEVQRSTNSIADLIKGATLTLTGTGSSTVTVERDTDAIVKNVQEFVKAYNNLIGLVKDNLAKPADDDTMNPLQGDALLKQISNHLYNTFNSGVQEEEKGLATYMEFLGLSIDKGVKSSSLVTGKITFDEATFRKALADDPNKVIKAFTNEEPDATGYPNAGVITKLSGIIKNYASSAGGLISSKITGYDAEIKYVDERMERMSLRLEMYETRLKQQFSTMETMLSTLQSEQKWLTQQFEALIKSNSK